MKLFLVRHGETLWNIEHRFQGHGDSPLTETGIAQAEAAAEFLCDYSFDAFYSSSLGRAMTTASMISEKVGRNVIPLDLLREKRLGIAEGKTLFELSNSHPELIDPHKRHNPDFHFPEGESGYEFSERCTRAVEYMYQNHPDGTVLAVTHGGVLASVFRRAIGLSLDYPRAFSIRNCSVNVLLIDQRQWFIETWGAVDHLREASSLAVVNSFV